MASFLSWKFILVLVAVVLVNAAGFGLSFLGMPGAGISYVPPVRLWVSRLGLALIAPMYAVVAPSIAIGLDWKIGAAVGMLVEAIIVHLGAGWLSSKRKGKPLQPRNLFRFRTRELLVVVTFICLGCGAYAGWRTCTTRGPAYRDRMGAMGIHVYGYEAYNDKGVESVLIYMKYYQRWLSSRDTSARPALPPELLKMKNLTRLSFDGLTSLPPEIGGLTNLRELYLDDHDLTTLPPEIGDLSNLRVLNLRGNDLTTLPPEIGRLATLEKLDLVGNPITDSALEYLATLKNLELVLLQETQVTEAGVEKLRQALPMCTVHRVYRNGG